MDIKNTSENFYSSNNDKDEIDLGKIFRFLLMQSKIILSFVLVAFILAFLNYTFSVKQYQITSLLQYEKFNQNIFDPSKALQMASSSPSSDISNLVELYESRTNYLKVIKDLKLNINVMGLSDDESIDLEIFSDLNNPTARHNLKFLFMEDGFTLVNDNSNETQLSKYGKQINYKDLKIIIKSVKLNNLREIDVRYQSPEGMYNLFKAKMDIESNVAGNSFFRNEGLITVSYVTDDIDLGKKIINYANESFLSQRIFDETEKSRKAINFIESNIKSIERTVEENKSKLKQFREKNKSIDVSLETAAIVSKIQSLDEALSSIEIELAKAEEVYTSNNPAYLNLINKKALVERQKESVLSEIEMMPKEQQEYIDLYNELEISQALFEELESRRLGFSILEASTIGDIRVVDKAYVDSLVSPKLFGIIVITLLAFIVASIFAVIRGYNFLPITNPAELFDNNIQLPVIGVIPKVEEDVLQVGKDLDDGRLNMSIESLIVNITSLQNKQLNKNILTITSPSPSNGKSTVAMNLAEGFAKINKKVLLVDGDLKRGNIAAKYNLHSISEKTFNSIDESTIHKYSVKDNFYLIPRVKGLANSFQFFFSQTYKEKIEFFKENFDFIIFDTGPILSVADSSILVEQSDINMLIVRHGINRINEIKQSIDNFKQINKNIDGIVYNAYAKPKSYYGYYGLYGNYSYQYYAEKYLYETYDYEKND